MINTRNSLALYASRLFHNRFSVGLYFMIRVRFCTSMLFFLHKASCWIGTRNRGRRQEQLWRRENQRWQRVGRHIGGPIAYSGVDGLVQIKKLMLSNMWLGTNRSPWLGDVWALSMTKACTLSSTGAAGNVENMSIPDGSSMSIKPLIRSRPNILGSTYNRSGRSELVTKSFVNFVLWPSNNFLNKEVVGTCLGLPREAIISSTESLSCMRLGSPGMAVSNLTNIDPSLFKEADLVLPSHLMYSRCAESLWIKNAETS